MLIHHLIAGLIVTVPLFLVRRPTDPGPDLAAIDRVLDRVPPVVPRQRDWLRVVALPAGLLVSLIVWAGLLWGVVEVVKWLR